METGKLDRIRFVTRHFNDLQGLRTWVPLGLLILSVGGTTYFDNPSFLLLRLMLFLVAFLVAFVASRYYRLAFGEVETQPLSPVQQPQTLSIFSPAGPTPRLAVAQQPTPGVRFVFIPLVLAVALFSIFYAISPAILIEEDESLIQPPWVASDSVSLLQPASIFMLSPEHHPVTALEQSWSTIRAVGGQFLYALLGASFLGIWLWRERRPSQSYYLVLGVALLGLSALGRSLGYLLGKEGGPPPIVNLFVPAVTHLWIALLLCGTAMIVAGLLDHWQLARVMGKSALEDQP